MNKESSLYSDKMYIVDNNYMRVMEQTHAEKMAMYMKCTKKELAEMLIMSNLMVKNLYLQEGSGEPTYTYIKPKLY